MISNVGKGVTGIPRAAESLSSSVVQARYVAIVELLKLPIRPSCTAELWCREMEGARCSAWDEQNEKICNISLVSLRKHWPLSDCLNGSEKGGDQGRLVGAKAGDTLSQESGSLQVELEYCSVRS